MNQNWLIIALAGLVPLIIGMIWYNPKVLGGAWMRSVGFTEEDSENVNMPLMIGLTLLFGFMISLMLSVIVIHQNGLIALLAMDPDFAKAGTDTFNYIQNFKESYGTVHRSFGHGALHGTIFGLLSSVPFIGSLAFHEKRSFTYVAVHCGYWILCTAIMGGIICQWT